MTDERRVEVAAKALRARGHGCPYHHTPVLTPFGGCDTCRAIVDDARAVVAALDAHDGDLRERLAGAVEALEPEDYACPHGDAPYRMRTAVARLIRNRP